MSDLMTGLKELSTSFADYDNARKYYEGDISEYFSSARLARLLAEAGERYRVNLAKTPVDVMASRLRISSISVPGDDSASAVLQRIAEANDLELHGPNLNRRAVQFGDAYAIVWPFDDAAPESDENDDGTDPDDEQLDDEQRQGVVEISYVSPLLGRMIYDTERPNRKAFFIMKWEDEETGLHRVNLYYADRVERWQTRAGTKGEQEQDWEPYVGGDVDNPYGEIPVFHFRTDAPYGEPEHYAAYGLQDALNKYFVTLVSTSEATGFPQRYALSDPDAALDGNFNDPDWEDDAEATESASSRNSSSMRGGPGTVATLDGIKAVGQWDSADPAAFLEPMEFVIKLMAQVTSTPMHYFDVAGDRPSGESLRAADAPLEDKAKDRRLWLGATWQEMARFALKVYGIKVSAVDIRWEPSQVAGDLAAWDVITAKIANGVPQRQALLEAGYDPEQVDEWLTQREADMDLSRRVSILTAIGDAVQKLGAGVGFGILDPEEAKAVIERVIGQAAPAPGSEEVS